MAHEAAEYTVVNGKHGQANAFTSTTDGICMLL